MVICEAFQFEIGSEFIFDGSKEFEHAVTNLANSVVREVVVLGNLLDRLLLERQLFKDADIT